MSSVIRFRLVQRLTAFSRRRVAHEGIVASPEWEKRMEFMVNNGVTRMATANAMMDEQRIRAAEANIQRYVARVVERAMESKHYPKVDADDFDEVYKKLCPIWPFC